MNNDYYKRIAIVGDGKTYCNACASKTYRHRLAIMERDEDFVQDNSGGYLRGLMAYQVPNEATCEVCGKTLKH